MVLCQDLQKMRADKGWEGILSTSSWMGAGLTRSPPLRSYWQLAIGSAKGVIFFSSVATAKGLLSRKQLPTQIHASDPN